MTDYPITPTPFRSVVLTDRFWLPRLETNRTITIPSVLRRCEQTGRIDNFRKAAGLMKGPYVGSMPFEDTDVYKAIEGASCSLAQHPDAALESRLDALIDIIARAQEPDGYLYTNRTIDPRDTLPDAGPERWSSLVMSHELYNCGHLYEAACAHFMATGKRTLLDVAVRSAGLVGRVFGPEGRHDVCGHPIVEMGLARLYRATLDHAFLESARFFLEQRGRHETRPQYSYAGNPCYCQDHLPVLEQREAVGHAVRAAYLYCGMADMAALWPDPAYAEAIALIWQDVVRSKVFLTGGIGARHIGEAFGDAYELPNEGAYAETCASIGSVMWNQRLFLLTGESKYCDVLEQTLYNGLLSGVSLSGDEFFYVNPLESDGRFPFNHGSAGRKPWFDVSCCPTNICRFLPSLPGCIYATRCGSLYVNLFIASRAEVAAGASRFEVIQDTDYPWGGEIRLRIAPLGAADGGRAGAPVTSRHPGGAAPLRLMIRIPGWASGRIMGADLYSFERPSDDMPVLRVNGAEVAPAMEEGYAVIDREWSDGDSVELTLPLPVRKVLCDPRVGGNRGRAALQRGPLVYCVEQRDAAAPLEALSLGDEASLSARREPGLLGGVVVVRGSGFTAVPYYAWGNRGAGPMRVWLKNG